jgi:hypothetical protein
VHYKISDMTDHFSPGLRGCSGTSAGNPGSKCHEIIHTGGNEPLMAWDHSAQSWDQAIKALMEGKVAFCSMGDWADGEFLWIATHSCGVQSISRC